MSRQIRTSAKAVIIQNGKLLVIKLNDGKEEWYILPGGGQDCEEILPQTVEREVREEAGIEVKCKDLLFVIEGVHGESFHRMDLVFLCDYLGTAPNATLHIADGKIAVASCGSAEKAQRYVMSFVRTKKADIPERWKGCLQFTEQGCIVRVEERDCDRAVIEMLEAGWSLRGMCSENGICEVSI